MNAASPPHVQTIFTVGNSSEYSTEKSTPVNEIPGELAVPVQPPTSKVQFPETIEQKYYTSEFKPPIEVVDDIEPLPTPPTRKEKVLNYLYDKFPGRIIRRVLKCTLAYFITSLFCLIHPLSEGLDIVAPTMVTTGMLFSHPGRSMGAQIDATITAVLGVVAAVLYAFAGMAASVQYNVLHPTNYQTEPNGRYLNATFLFVGILGAQMLRQVYPKLHFFSLQFMIIQIFVMTRALDYLTIPYELPLNYGIPLIIGHAIALAVNLLIWPETAVDGLGRALKETVTSSKNMLRMITTQFFLDPTSAGVAESEIDEIAEQMRKGMTKVKAAYKEAKYEMSYAYVHPKQLGTLRKSMGRLTKHLSILGGCLKTERELFESVIQLLKTDTKNPDGSDDEASYVSEVDEGNRPLSSTSRTSYSEVDLNLIRAALRATNEYTNSGGKYSGHTSRIQSTNASPNVSRPASVHNSDEDEDYTEQNQKSVGSIKSFLNLPRLSIPVPKPPKKTKKHTDFHHRHLLMTYLESLRDPLMELSLDCVHALECVCDSIENELDIDNDDDDISIRQTWRAYFKHNLKISKKVKTESEEANVRHKGAPKCNCSQNIRLAIVQFDKEERDRMHALYELNKKRMGDEALDLGMRQELFLVFFFIFTMREVANELQEMTIYMDELRLHACKSSFNGKKRKQFYFPVLSQKMWQKWAKDNNYQNMQDKGGYTFDALTTYIPKKQPKIPEPKEELRLRKMQTNVSLKRNRSMRMTTAVKNVTSDQSKQEESSPTMLRRRNPFSQNNSCEDICIPVPEISDEYVDEKAPLMLRIRYGIWSRLQFVNRYEFKFALKMAVAVLILCIPAWIIDSIEWYEEVRGQWAPMAVIAIMNPTSGGTMQAGFWRIVGTLVGAFFGWAALVAGDGSPYLIAVFAVLLAIPSFYIHIGSTFNKVGLVILTTYMVVALGRYSNPPDETIVETVWKRTMTLIVGIMVALMLNTLVWPFVARHMVRKSIAGCLIQLEDYYTYVMGTYLYHDPHTPPTDEEIIKGQKLESKIQSAIDACTVLLDLTDHEPRFRGPFPKAFYKEMIVSMGNLLDRMLSTRIALLNMPPPVKNDICKPDYHTNRREMIAALLLTIHTLSTALRIKKPFPPFMPDPRGARDKLMNRRRSDPNKTNWVRFRNLTWFAMACSSEEIIDELDYMANLIKYIVGTNDYEDSAKRIDHYTNCANHQPNENSPS
ncbi:Fusaric acid resistance protein-like-domain-containing protein [Pilobolus umbonatus]|nr:Fusaric acid resistance protein-like-domain-containing protein [Pilobolus umbonatus]